MKKHEQQPLTTAEFIKKYKNGLQRRYEKIKSVKPIHPETGEEAEFVAFLRNYPIYRTQSGKELISIKGKFKVLIRNQE